MNRLLNWLTLIIKKQKGLKRWQRVVTVLAAMITFATTYALILPAITVEKNSTGDVGGMYLEKTAKRDNLDDYEITTALPIKTLKASGTDYTVTLAYDESSNIPEEASLTVSEISKDSKEYQTYLDETKKRWDLRKRRLFPASLRASLISRSWWESRNLHRNRVCLSR